VDDDERRYRAAASKDARFDGQFFIGVTSTGIYCRPSCPAITPKRANMRFYPSAAAAQEEGFRACKRCRPDASPGSPEWNIRADVAARAMRLIADGAVDRAGVTGLARRLGYSERQVNRAVTAELGAGPLALARAQRAQTARVLTETTHLPLSDIAFAAGFASIRQFNATIREVFALTPTELRDRAARRRDGDAPAPGTIRLRLAYRPPIDLDRLFRFLATRAIAGVEDVTDGCYRRTLTLPHGIGLVALRPGAVGALGTDGARAIGGAQATDGAGGGGRPGGGAAPFIDCELQLQDLKDLAPAVQRCRRLLDLDADPATVSGSLRRSELLRPLVEVSPGRRVPGHVDGAELALRAVLGQQVSVAAARRLGTRLTEVYGKPLGHLPGGPTEPDSTAKPDSAVESLTHCFPAADTIAGADPDTLPMPRSRARALVGLAAALASGALRLDPGADRDEAEHQLLALPGIGPWTAGYIRMRALSDPDAFLPTDIGVRHGLAALGALAPGEPAARQAEAAARLAEGWRPWRSYALQHLWAHLEDLAISERKAS
jgi:AraC family transcriptional regulator, regulatory protein of adaptative response / DNA-3-methyladenine glycosylase II